MANENVSNSILEVIFKQTISVYHQLYTITYEQAKFTELSQKVQQSLKESIYSNPEHV